MFLVICCGYKKDKANSSSERSNITPTDNNTQQQNTAGSRPDICKDLKSLGKGFRKISKEIVFFFNLIYVNTWTPLETLQQFWSWQPDSLSLKALNISCKYHLLTPSLQKSHLHSFEMCVCVCLKLSPFVWKAKLNSTEGLMDTHQDSSQKGVNYFQKSRHSFSSLFGSTCVCVCVYFWVANTHL